MFEFAAAVFKAEDPIVATNETAATSKKRRKRKKKKKKKKEATASTASSSASISTIDDDASSESEASAEPTKKNDNNEQPDKNNNNSTIKSKFLTPQEILRNQLIERDGYNPCEIDQAMGEMWDKGLPYDEYEAVLSYLQNIAAIGSNGINIEADVDVDVEFDGGNFNEEIDTMVIEPESSSPAQQSNFDGINIDRQGTNDNKVNDESYQNDNKQRSDGENHDDGNGCDYDGQNKDVTDDKKEEDQYESRQTKKAPATMAAKLDMVAGFEILTDAIFALTQWVNKAAKLEDIEDLCRVEKTLALPTVVRRGISTEITDQKNFETVVQPALVGLLISVLARFGIEYKDKERIENLLKQAWKVSRMKMDEDENEEESDGEEANCEIADRVANFIVSRITIAMNESKNNGSENDIIRDGYIGCDNGDDELAVMTRQRDKSKQNAIQACVTVKSTMKKVLNISNDSFLMNGDGGGSSSFSLENQNLLLLIVNQETKDRFIEEKLQLEELKSCISKGESDEVQDLRSTIETLEKERVDVQGKIYNLTLTLEKLKAQNKDIGSQIVTLEQSIGNHQRNDTEETQQLEQQISVAKEAVRYGNIVCTLASMMKTYGKSLENITSKGVVGDSIINKTCLRTGDNPKASDTMRHYLRTVRDYFLTESKFEIELRQQILLNTNNIAKLKLEQAQCARLGMSKTTGQIKESISSKEKLLQLYVTQLTDLGKSGSSMYTELILLLEKYEIAVSNDGAENFFPTDLLRDVPTAIKELKISNGNNLERFVLEVTIEQSTETGGVDNNKELPIHLPGKSQSSSIRKQSTAPIKLTWANSTNTQTNSSCTLKQSFLDIIQTQERQSKNEP